MASSSQSQEDNEFLLARAREALRELRRLNSPPSPPPVVLEECSSSSHHPTPPVEEDEVEEEEEYSVAQTVYQTIAKKNEETRKLKAALEEKDEELSLYERQRKEDQQELERLRRKLEKETGKTEHAQKLLKRTYQSVLELRLAFNEVLKQGKMASSSGAVQGLETRLQILTAEIEVEASTNAGDLERWDSRVREEIQAMNRILGEFKSTDNAQVPVVPYQPSGVEEFELSAPVAMNIIDSTTPSFATPTIIRVSGTADPIEVDDSEPVIVNVIGASPSPDVVYLSSSSSSELSQELELSSHQKATRSLWGRVHKPDLSRSPPGSYCTCGIKFKSKEAKLHHLRYYSQAKKFKCHWTGCGMSFVGASVLKQHLKQKHKSDMRGGKFGCRFCGAIMSTRQALSAHRRSECPEVVRRGRKLVRVRSPASATPDVEIARVVPDNQASTSQQRMDEGKGQNVGEIKHRIDRTKSHLGAYCTCGHLSVTLNALNAHLWYRNNQTKFKCNLCGVSYPGRGFFDRHMFMVHKMVPIDGTPQRSQGGNSSSNSNQGSLRNPTGKRRGKKRGLKHGVNRSRAREGFYCLCGLERATFNELRAHIHELNVTGVKYSCDTCGQALTTVKSVRRHMTRKHKTTPEILRGCKDCGGVFRSNEELREHRKVVHNIVTRRRKPRLQKRIPDNITNHGFQSMEEESPSTSSSAPLPFYCKCGQGFPNERTLIHHIQAQYQDAVFTCAFCNSDDRFGSHADLKSHVLHCHQNVQYKKNYGCTQCGRTFKTEDHYINHCRNEHQ